MNADTFRDTIEKGIRTAHWTYANCPLVRASRFPSRLGGW